MIKAIYATDNKNGIGKNGSIPWPYNSTDMRHFSKQTTGNIVVMGAKTWLDPLFPAPLKNRENYVISRTENFKGAIMLREDFKNKIKKLNEKTDKIIYIIGGESIISQCYDIIDELDISLIDGDYECDKFLNIPSEFHFVGETLIQTDSGTNTFRTYSK